MDKEIEILEEKLEKYKQIKQEMMEELWLFGTYYAKSFLKCQARKTLVQKLSKFLNP